jgi:hypothetical protein
MLRLHPAVQELAGFLVVEFGDHLVEEVYQVGGRVQVRFTVKAV